MKIGFYTLGCKLNFAETSAIGKALLTAGHTRAADGEQAEVCIINTCSVTDAADRKGRQAIHRIHRENPNAILIVTGCYAQLKPQEVKQIEGVQYVVTNDDKDRIPDLIAQFAPPSDLHNSLAQHYAPRTRFFLKVQDGCDYFCTYCTIPYARGRSRNQSISEVIRRAEIAIAEGYKELVLTGVNIGDFGKSTGESFINLLRALDDIDADVRYRISSCEPNLLTDEIIDFVSHSRHFAPHFHIPLQSGNNEMLKIMHRRYTRELFAERISHIKQVMPDAFIGVDCMVGVRGETEEMFSDYVKFVSSLPVSQLHVFTYSERAGTRMLNMPLIVVPNSVRKTRSELLHQLSEQKLHTFYEQHQGSERTVLWESKETDGLMSGFTENYIKVFRPYQAQKINTFEKIII